MENDNKKNEQKQINQNEETRFTLSVSERKTEGKKTSTLVSTTMVYIKAQLNLEQLNEIIFVDLHSVRG